MHSDRKRCRFRPALSLPLLLGAGAALATAPVAGDTFRNPIMERGADPWVIQHGGQYFYTGTTGGDVKVSRSPWLQSVNSNRQKVWDPPADTRYGHNIWAPELHRLNGKWYIYVAADDRHDVNHRMYVLEADSQDPQASYTLKGQISIPEHRWAIDGTVLEHGDKQYFIWSGRTSSLLDSGNDSGGSQSLYIAEMSNPWTLSGNRTRISSPSYAWERHGHPVNEGPQILKHGDDVWLTYSGSGYYVPEYAIGALKLTGSNPMLASSWAKQRQPLFDQGNGVEGTGHASFVKSPDGTEDWIVYHARTQPSAPRDVRIQRFTFGADGVPQFGEPLPTGQEAAAPSGVPLVTFIPNLSFERGGAGWVEEFRATGDVGVVANDGTAFGRIAGGDGPRVGYLGAGVKGGIHQEIGLAHAGEYKLTIALGINDEQAEAAAANPGTFLLRLESIGLHPGGSANDSDVVILGEQRIDSGDLEVAMFTDFSVSGMLAAPDRVGTWLRVALYSQGAGEMSPWQVKMDHMRLEYTAPEGARVPEPAAGATMLLGGSILLRRRAIQP